MRSKSFGVIPILLIGHLALSNGMAAIARPKPSRMVASAKLSVDELTKNVEFEFCKSNLPMVDSAQLNGLAELIISKNYAIALRGHADAIGTYLGNWKISEARAGAVKAYLLSRGVQEDRIIVTAFGSTIPIASNKTSDGRKKNRRVEIRLKPIVAALTQTAVN